MSDENILYEDEKVKITYIPNTEGYEFLDKRRNLRGDLGWSTLEMLARNCERIIQEEESDKYILDEYLFHKLDLIGGFSDLFFNSQIGVPVKDRMRKIADILIKTYKEEERQREEYLNEEVARLTGHDQIVKGITL